MVMSATTVFAVVFLLTTVSVVDAASCGRNICNRVAEGQSSVINNASPKRDLCSCTCGGNGERLLHVATRASCLSCIDLLNTARGCPIDPIDNNGNTPLFLAAEKCDAIIAKDLLNRGANANAVNNANDTPLCVVARGTSTDCQIIVGALVDRNANPCPFCGIGVDLPYVSANLQIVRDEIGNRGGRPKDCPIP